MRFLGDWLFHESLEAFLDWRFQEHAERLTREALVRPGKVARVALRREIADWAEVEPLVIGKISKVEVKPVPDRPERQVFVFGLGAVGTTDLLTRCAASMARARTVRGKVMAGGLIFCGTAPRSDTAVLSTILISEVQLITDHVKAQRAVCDAYNAGLAAKAQAYVAAAIDARQRSQPSAARHPRAGRPG